MQNGAIEVLMHVLTVLLYGAVATGLAGLGVMFEYRSYLFISSGETFVALWMGGLGLLLFVFAFLVVRDRAAGAVTEMRAALVADR